MRVLAGCMIFLTAYLLGSINFADLITRIVRKKDIRELGNQNPGAANVTRSLGFGYGLLVFILDFLKAYTPMLVARRFVFQGTSALSYFGILITGLLAVLGHCRPIYYHFKGGRGISSIFAVYLFHVPAEFIFSTLLAALIVLLFVHNVRFRIGRWIPIFFAALTPFVVFFTSLLVTPESPLYRIVGERPWYMVIGTFATSLFLLSLNFSFTGHAVKELEGKEPEWQE